MCQERSKVLSELWSSAEADTKCLVILKLLLSGVYFPSSLSTKRCFGTTSIFTVNLFFDSFIGIYFLYCTLHPFSTLLLLLVWLQHASVLFLLTCGLCCALLCSAEQERI